MKLSLEKFDAELATELEMNAYLAKLMMFLAELVRSRSHAQIAGEMMNIHSGDTKEAIDWLVEARRDIAQVLKVMVLHIALESKEQMNSRGLGQ